MQRQSEVYLKVIYFCCCFCRVKRKWQIQAGCLRGLVKGCLPLWLDPCAREVQCLWRRLQQESKKPYPFLILRLPFTALSNFFFHLSTSRFPYLTSSSDLVYLQPCHFLSQPGGRASWLGEPPSQEASREKSEKEEARGISFQIAPSSPSSSRQETWSPFSSITSRQINQSDL